MDKNKKLFPQRLWELIHDDKYSFCLRWSQDGQRVYLNRNEFETHYLKTPSNQFHTQKAISFVRQMNMYGFRKVDDCFYENDNFKRNCPHLLKNMIRKHSNRSYFSSPPSSVGPSHHLHASHSHPPYSAHLPSHQHLPPLLPFSQQQSASSATSLPLATELATVQQTQLANKPATILNQAELRRIHQHLHNQQHLQESILVASLQHQRQNTPPTDPDCDQPPEVARSISNLGAAIAAQTPLASSLYYRLAAGLNFSQNNQQQTPTPTASATATPTAASQQDHQLLSQLMQVRNQLATTNNPNSLLARPANACLEQSNLDQSQIPTLQHCHQQQRQQLSQQTTNNQLNFLDSASGRIATLGHGLSAAEQATLQENLVRTFLQLHTRQQQTTLNNNQMPQQLQNKPFLQRTLQEQNLLQSLATLTSGDQQPPPGASSPLELVVKKRIKKVPYSETKNCGIAQ